MSSFLCNPLLIRPAVGLSFYSSQIHEIIKEIKWSFQSRSHKISAPIMYHKYHFSAPNIESPNSYFSPLHTGCNDIPWTNCLQRNDVPTEAWLTCRKDKCGDLLGMTTSLVPFPNVVLPKPLETQCFMPWQKRKGEGQPSYVIDGKGESLGLIFQKEVRGNNVPNFLWLLWEPYHNLFGVIISPHNILTSCSNGHSFADFSRVENV